MAAWCPPPARWARAKRVASRVTEPGAGLRTVRRSRAPQGVPASSQLSWPAAIGAVLLICTCRAEAHPPSPLGTACGGVGRGGDGLAAGAAGRVIPQQIPAAASSSSRRICASGSDSASGRQRSHAPAGRSFSAGSWARLPADNSLKSSAVQLRLVVLPGLEQLPGAPASAAGACGAADGPLRSPRTSRSARACRGAVCAVACCSSATISGSASPRQDEPGSRPRHYGLRRLFEVVEADVATVLSRSAVAKGPACRPAAGAIRPACAPISWPMTASSLPSCASPERLPPTRSVVPVGELALDLPFQSAVDCNAASTASPRCRRGSR